MTKISGKKKSRHYLLWGLFFCLPLLIIAFIFLNYHSSNLFPEKISVMRITVPDGRVFEFEDKEIIKSYADGINNALKLESPLRDIQNEKPAILQFESGQNKIEFSLYAEKNLSGCFLRSPSGKFSVFPSETAAGLMARPEFSYIYSELFLPELFVCSGNEKAPVLPVKYKWTYENTLDRRVQYKETPTFSGEGGTIHADLKNSLSFSKKPDELTVIIRDGEGNPMPGAEFSEIIFEKDTKFSVQVNAKWKNGGSKECFGEAEYNFPVFYDVKASVVPRKYEFAPGEVIVCDAENLNPDEKITVDTEMKVSQVKFFEDGDRAYIKFTVDQSCPEGDYSAVFKIGDINIPVGFKVKK